MPGFGRSGGVPGFGRSGGVPGFGRSGGLFGLKGVGLSIGTGSFSGRPGFVVGPVGTLIGPLPFSNAGFAVSGFSGGCPTPSIIGGGLTEPG